jgi:hypothetical protein
MKYVMHLDLEEFEQLIDRVVDKRIANVEKALAYLTEIRDNEFFENGRCLQDFTCNRSNYTELGK